MTQALRVVTPGIHTTVQDAGRTGFRGIGVPASGPLDRISMRLANALVGNPPDTAVLEMLVGGPTMEVLADSVRIALAGCNTDIEVRSGGTRRVPAGQSVRLVRGESFRIGSLGDSLSACLAIEGGLDLPRVLDSMSTYVRGAFGGLHGRRLQQRDLLPLKRGDAEKRGESALPRKQDLALEQAIRVVPGPQADHFTTAAMQTFLSSEYVVSAQSDRMGYRLDGPGLAHTQDYNIVSDGIVSGAIQVPGSGQPIILMVDNQTTGGYPKIATVISADIPVLGRRRPGHRLRFTAVNVNAAEALRRAQEADIQQQCAVILTSFRG